VDVPVRWATETARTPLVRAEGARAKSPSPDTDPARGAAPAGTESRSGWPRHRLYAWYLGVTLPAPVVLLPLVPEDAADRRRESAALPAFR
jgi:hypothetical protein